MILGNRQRVVVTENKWSNRPTYPLLSPFWVRSNRAFPALFLTAVLLTSCATPDLARSHSAIIQTQTFKGDSNVYCDYENKMALIDEGIPASYFAWSDSRNLFFMTRLQAIQAANLRAQERNPNVWTP